MNMVFSYEYGCWADVVDGIGLAALFSGRVYVTKVNLLDVETACFLESLLIVSDSLALYFVTNLMFPLCFEGNEKTRNEKTCNLDMAFRSAMLWRPDW